MARIATGFWTMQKRGGRNGNGQRVYDLWW